MGRHDLVCRDEVEQEMMNRAKQILAKKANAAIELLDAMTGMVYLLWGNEISLKGL